MRPARPSPEPPAGDARPALRPSTFPEETQGVPDAIPPANRARGLRIVLVDTDHRTHGEIGRMLATHAPDWKLHSCYHPSHAALDIPTVRPHVALLELDLGEHSGLDWAARLKQATPELPIVMLTARNDSDAMLQSIQAGACGYILKPVAFGAFLSSIQRAAYGGMALCAKAERVLAGWLGSLSAAMQCADLSRREREVLPLILQGLGDKEIAQKANCAISTVHGHRTHLYKKYGAHSIAQLQQKCCGRERKGRRSPWA